MKTNENKISAITGSKTAPLCRNNWMSTFCRKPRKNLKKDHRFFFFQQFKKQLSDDEFI